MSRLGSRDGQGAPHNQERGYIRIHLTAIFMVPMAFQRLSLVNLVATPLSNVVGLSPDLG